MIEIRRLTKRYADGTTAVSNLSLTLGKKITGILGRNGAGKTTTLRILSTQMMPTSGTVRINGLDLVKDVDRIRGIIASIPQEAKVMGIASPMEHVSMYLNARGLEKDEIEGLAKGALKELNMWQVRDKPTADLSGGMKRKVFVAMAIASKAEIIFLDEPTTGLDPISRLEVWSAIKKLDCDTVITTHYMEEAKELADEVVLIDNGRCVAQGSVPELLKSFNGKVRVEGPTGKYKVGGMRISYLSAAEARKFVGKGYYTRPASLEDLLIVNGGGAIED